MKRIYFLLAGLILFFPAAQATHLVGGDLGMKNVGTYEYLITLNLYFDEVSGSSDAEDQQLIVSAFSKATNRQVEVFTLRKVGSEPLLYTNPECKQGSVRTRIIRYAGKYVLSPDVYNDPQGYYLAWERCCRNAGITNIIQPGNTGMTFYMEFPRVQLPNGTPFINNSPVLNEPLSDYLCREELYTYSFQATDADNDSLVYKLTTPVAGHTSSAAPFSQNLPGPYLPVNWAPGYSVFEMIQGTLPLTINSRTGVISVRPKFTGLFVFGVTAEEYRNGVKIGEVKREMQIKVINCVPNSPPALTLFQPLSGNRYQTGDTIVVTGKEDFCTRLLLTDPDANQTLTLLTKPVNFTGIPPTVNVISTTKTDSTVTEVELCWGDCGLGENQEFFLVDLTAKDNGCSVPKTETIRVLYRVIPKPNDPPVITSSLAGNTAIAMIGNTLNFTITGTDADNDNLRFSYEGRGFNLADYGMELVPVSERAGEVVQQFSWTPDCSAFNQKFFDLQFAIKDNSCFARNTDTLMIRINIAEPDSKADLFLPPNIFTPNNDELNDFFEMPNLPNDNCTDSFQKLVVYNRWGQQVYESDDRNFKWDGKNVSDGVYFYVIFFQQSQYRGTVNVMR